MMSEKMMQDKVLEILRGGKRKPRTYSVDVYIVPGGAYTIQIGGRTVVHTDGTPEEARADASERAKRLAARSGKTYVVNVY